MNDEVETLATLCVERGRGGEAKVALERVLAGEDAMRSTLRSLAWDRQRRQGDFLPPAVKAMQA
jgi:hypothetical protein